MPDKLFYSTGIPVSLWIITNKKAQPGKTLFIDARDMGTMVSRKLREFTDEDIAKVSGAFDAFRAGTLEEEKGFLPSPQLRTLPSKTTFSRQAAM